MNEKAIVIITLLLTPAILATTWFVGYVFIEEYLLWVLFVSGIIISYGTLLFGLSFKIHTKQSLNKNLSTRSHFYEDLYTNSPLPYLTIDDKGGVLSGNSAAAKLFNTTINEITDVNIFTHLSGHEDINVEILFSKISAGVSLKDVELILTTPNSNQKWVSLSLHVNQATNQRLLSLVDITEKKRIDIAKSEFASLVTHQLRTPVAAMRWNAELLEQTLSQPATELQQKYIFKVKRNIQRMLDLINDFLSVSKLETGTFESSSETINLSTYFDTILDEYAGLIKQKQLQIENRYDPPNKEITIDSRLFHIITSNLLSNAVKYTPNNGQIIFTYKIENNTCQITVADTGIGIPKDDQERLFNKFFRASNAVQHRAEGTGLGLYIVKQSVEKLHGAITFSSVENQGTTFTVIIPFT